MKFHGHVTGMIISVATFITGALLIQSARAYIIHDHMGQLDQLEMDYKSTRVGERYSLPQEEYPFTDDEGAFTVTEEEEKELEKATEVIQEIQSGNTKL